MPLFPNPKRGKTKGVFFSHFVVVVFVLKRGLSPPEKRRVLQKSRNRHEYNGEWRKLRNEDFRHHMLVILRIV